MPVRSFPYTPFHESDVEKGRNCTHSTDEVAEEELKFKFKLGFAGTHVC